MKEVPVLDLHGVKHEDAALIVEEWVIMWDYRIKGFTGRIITGNSVKMRVLAEGALKKNKFDYHIGFDSSIIVTGKI